MGEVGGVVFGRAREKFARRVDVFRDMCYASGSLQWYSVEVEPRSKKEVTEGLYFFWL